MIVNSMLFVQVNILTIFMSFMIIGENVENKEDEEIVNDKELKKKSKIELKIDFDTLKNNNSKRTIFSKNRGSSKSFDFKGLSNIENDGQEMQRSTTHMKITSRLQNIKIFSQPIPLKNNENIDKRKYKEIRKF